MGAFDDFDARYAAVNKPAPAVQKTGSAFDDFEHRHAAANASTENAPMSLDEKILGPNEAALRAITGAATSVGTGLRGIGAGIGTALAGGSYDDVINNAANEIRNRSQQLTYEPSTEFGRQIADSNLNPLNWPGKVGHAVGGAVAASGIPGAPEIATALDTGIQMAMPVAAGKVISKGASVAKDAGGAPQEVPATQSPDLQKALDDFHTKAAQGKAPINDEAQQRHLEADSLPVPVRLTKGQATQDPSQLSAEQNERGASPELANHFNQQNADLVANFDAIKEKAAPDVTATNKVEHGQNLVDAYKEMDDKAQADVNAKYQALRDANGGQFPVDGKAFANKALSDLANSDVEESLPSDVRAAVTKYQNGQPMDFNRFTGMQKVLSAASRKADRAGDGNASHAISIVRDSLESLPLTDETAAIKPLADAARAAARARFQRIESDPAYAAAVKDGAAKGEPSPLADKFVEKYVVGAPAANVAKMRQNLAGDPMAGQNLAAATIDHIRDNAIKSGNLSQAALNKQLANLGPKIPTLLDPESAAHVNNLGKVAGYTQAQPRGSFVNNSNTAVAQKAMNVASGVASKVPVAGPYVAEKIQQKAQQTRLKDMLKPGAGIAK